MIGALILLGVIVIEFLCLVFLKPTWLRAGIYSSIALGALSVILSIILQMQGNPENVLLHSFFVLNMVLPIILSIEIHLFADRLEKRAKINSIPQAKKER